MPAVGVFGGWGLGFQGFSGVEGSKFKVWGVWDLGFWASGSKFWGFGVSGLGP